MKELDNNRIEELLPRYCEGRLSEGERLEVEAWIDESEENKRVATQTFALYLAVDTVQVMKKVDTEKALLKVKGKMSDREVRRIVWWEWAQRAAAILFIPLLTLFIWQNWKGDTGEVAEMMEVKTSPGMTTSLTLPDGTIVYLNSESSLSYPSRFNRDFRRVTLSGEAYFEVAKDPEKKFILSTTHQSQIEVLGTCFNVEAYEQNTEVITTLIEGKVDFMFEKDAGVKHVFLSPREKLVYDSETDKVHLYKTSGKSELAWKDGEVVLDNTPLEEALWMLEKRYSVKFVIKNEKLKNSSFTGTFTNQRLEKILEYFKVSSKIRWQHINDDKDGSDRKKEIIEIY
ncbi:FecR domain-containing protein [Bacteroides thetaiotaomicron]|uniref:FecR domain-containing protein n=1 Tax=Bacteroides thetaiotaomicron TaxID=818 RepID=UPI0039C19128